MQEALTRYFEGEKNAGLFLAGIGVALLAAAAVLFPARWELRSLAITLLVFGLLEAAVGVGLYLKTGPQVARLVEQLTGDAAAFYAGERPRMAIVQRNFGYLESTWLVLIVASAAVAFWQKRNVTLSGIALGVLVSVAIILAFDIIAERRGEQYVDALGVHHP
jgi:hypothetical protein